MKNPLPFKLLATAVTAFLCACVVIGCRPTQPSTSIQGPSLAATTSYLESAARDLLGDSVHIVRLAEPGACPGHYDVRPSHALEVQACQALARFDFQKDLDARLKLAAQCQIISVSLRGGLCCPESYLTASHQLADKFVVLHWLTATNAEEKLKSLATRLDAQATQLRQQVQQTGLVGTPVLASGHQKDFCEWLGLKVAATFRSADTAGIAEIDRAIAAGELSKVKLVIANLPEGRRTADALGERLKAKVVVFGYFPVEKAGRMRFDDLLADNVQALIQAAQP
jgi:zinc transport system substrate-binding protein